MSHTMRQVYSKKGIRLIRGEAITTLLALADKKETFDALVTDPPYASGGQTLSAKSKPTSVKYQSSDAQKIFPDFAGDSRSQLSWMTWMTVWLNAARRLLKPGAPVLMFCDWRQLSAAVQSVQSGGFTYRGLIPWNKKNARPMPGGFRAQCEYLIFASNGKLTRKDVYLPGIFEHATPSKNIRRHATQKPIPLLVDVLGVVPDGGHVLDVFAGSGTTLHACRELDLQATGIEESDEIIQDAAEWLRGS